MTTYFIVQGYRFREKWKAEYYADWLTNHRVPVTIELRQVARKPRDRSKQDETEEQASEPPSPTEAI